MIGTFKSIYTGGRNWWREYRALGRGLYRACAH